MMDDDNKRKLYDALSEDYDMGEFEQFSQDVEDEGKRRKLYDAIKEEYDLPDFDGFTKQLGVGGQSAFAQNVQSVFDVPQVAADEQQPSGGNNNMPEGVTTEAAVDSMHQAGQRITKDELRDVAMGGGSADGSGATWQDVVNAGKGVMQGANIAQGVEPMTKTQTQEQTATVKAQESAPVSDGGNEPLTQQQIKDLTSPLNVYDYREKYPDVPEEKKYTEEDYRAMAESNPTAKPWRSKDEWYGMAETRWNPETKQYEQTSLGDVVDQLTVKAGQIIDDLQAAALGDENARQRLGISGTVKGKDGAFYRLQDFARIEYNIDEDYSNKKTDQAWKQALVNIISPKASALAYKMLEKIGDKPYDLFNQIRDAYYGTDFQLRLKDFSGLAGIDHEWFLTNIFEPELRKAARNKYKYDGGFSVFTDPKHIGRRMNMNDANTLTEEFVGKEIDDVFRKWDDAYYGKYEETEQGWEGEAKKAVTIPFIGTMAALAGQVSQQRKMNEYRDYDKIGDEIADEASWMFNSMIANPEWMAKASKEMERIGVGFNKYVDDYVLPEFMDTVMRRFQDTAIAREMPKSKWEYVVRQAETSFIGLVANMLTKSKGQREMREQAMAMTEQGRNPYTGEIGMGYKAAGTGLNMLADSWMFVGGGKLGSMAAQKFIANRIGAVAVERNLTLAAAARLIEEEGAQYIGRRLSQQWVQHVLSSGTTLGFFEGLKGGMESVYHGDDVWSVLGNTIKGAAHGAMMGAAFGSAGAATSALTYGWTGMSALAGKALGFLAETGTFYTTGELEKMAAGEEAFQNPFEGMLESGINLVAIKLSAPGAWPKFANAFRHPVKTAKEAMKGHGGSLTNEDIAWLKSETGGKDLTDALMAIRPSGRQLGRDANGRQKETEGYLDTATLRKCAAAYDRIMQDPNVPLDRKQRVARVLDAIVPPTGLPVCADMVRENGRYVVRTRDIDGKCVTEEMFSSRDAAQKAADKANDDPKNQRNRIESVEARVNENLSMLPRYLKEATAAASQKPEGELTDSDRRVMHLNGNEVKMIEVFKKVRGNQELTEEEQTLLDEYREVVGEYINGGKATEMFIRDFEEKYDLPAGSLREAINGRSKAEQEAGVKLKGGQQDRTEDGERMVQDYLDELSGQMRYNEMTDMQAEAGSNAKTEQQLYAEALTNSRVFGTEQGGDGMIHPVTLRAAGNEQGEQVYVIGGRLELREDGTVDTAKSDEQIIVRDEYGEPKTVYVDEIERVGEVIDPEQMKKDVNDAYEQDIEENGLSSISGSGEPSRQETQPKSQGAGAVRQEGGNQGEQRPQRYKIKIGDKEYDAEIVEELDNGMIEVSLNNGEPFPMRKEDFLGKAEPVREEGAKQAQPVQGGTENEQQPTSAAQGEVPAPVEPQPVAEEQPAAQAEGTGGENITLRIRGREYDAKIVETLPDGDVMVSIRGEEPVRMTREQLESMMTRVEGEQPESPVMGERNGQQVLAPTAEPGAPSGEQVAGNNEPDVTGGGLNEPMPMKTVDGKSKPDYDSATPQRTRKYLYDELGLSKEEADKFAEMYRDRAAKEFEELRNQEPRIEDYDEADEYAAAKRDWETRSKDAERRRDYWEEVRNPKAEEKPVEQQPTPAAQEEWQTSQVSTPVEENAPKDEYYERYEQEQDTVDRDGGLVRDEVSERSLSEHWRGALHVLGRNIGRRVRVVSGEYAKSVGYEGANGWFDPNDNTIYLNEARMTANSLESFIAGHELTHVMKTESPELWAEFVKAVKDAMGDDYVKAYNSVRDTYDGFIKNYNANHEDKLRRLSAEEIDEEVCCNWAGRNVLTDVDAARRIVEAAEKSGSDPKNIVRRVLDWLSNFKDMLLKAKSRGEDVDEQLSAVERAQQIWQGMYDEAVAKENASRDTARQEEAKQREATDNGEPIQGSADKEFVPAKDEAERAHQDSVMERNGIDPDEVQTERDFGTAVAIDETGAGGTKTEGVGTKHFSISALGNAAGLEAYETVKEERTTKSGRKIVTEKKIPLTDNEGNVIMKMRGKDGREKVFSARNRITVADLKDNPNSSWEMMIHDSQEIGVINEERADIIRQKIADMLNLALDLGSAENGGVKNMTEKWQWVGETVFKTVAKNGDDQYGTSIDITRVCKKNEQMIFAISEKQKQQGYGVTPGQILDLYRAIEEEGYQTPCPVCYVFSRYIRNGKYANGMINGMMKYGEHLPGGNDPWTARKWVNELRRLDNLKKASEKAVTQAMNDIDEIPDLIDDLWMELNSGADEARKAEIMSTIETLDNRYRRALDVYGQVSLTNWIKSFAIQSKNNRYVLRDDVKIPRTEEEWADFREHALDLRLTASVYRNYPAIQRMRKSAGSPGGKEITQASDNRPGEVAIGIGRTQETNMVNHYDLAINGKTPEERAKARKDARTELMKSVAIAAKQSLRGGQRMWSWSDNIERLAPDVVQNLIQMELVGGAVQSYSKQLEGINMVSKMGAYVNGSLMARGEGYVEVAPEDTTVVNGVRVTTKDVKGMARTYGKDEERVFSQAGSPVYEENGKYYTATFDDVVGVDPFSHDTADGGHLSGLFELNGMHDKAGNIMVGMNDMHIRTVLADPRVFFVIPWHSSGQSVHILQQMMNILGVDFKARDAVDYTSMQEEKMMTDGGITERLRNLWSKVRNEEDWACGIEGGIESGDGENLSAGQKRYRLLREQIFNGNAFREHPVEPTAPKKTKGMSDKKFKKKLAEYEKKMEEWRQLDADLPKMKEEIQNDFFLRKVYEAVGKVPDKQMTSGDNKYIYPYEYWDETSTYDTAKVNGARYLEYCRRLGRKPKFSGRWDTEDPAAQNVGNFMDSDGYWKLLIDRRMYRVDGTYQGLDPVDSSGFDAHDADPRWTNEHFVVTEVANDAATKDIVDKVSERERQRMGDTPAPNYEDFVLDYAEGERPMKGKASAIQRHQDVVAETAGMYKPLLKAYEEKKKAQEAERERRKAERGQVKMSLPENEESGLRSMSDAELVEESKKYKPRRMPVSEARPEPSVDDYYENTRATFEPVAEGKDVDAEWEELKADSRYEYKQSPKSGSEYLIDRETGDILRKSDHWGDVASCEWGLDGKPDNTYAIGKANIKDFENTDAEVFRMSDADRQAARAIDNEMRRRYEERQQQVNGESEAEESRVMFSVVDDPKEIERLEKAPKVKRYRAMVEIDGKLYPPMSVYVDGKLREPTEIGTWEKSDETPITDEQKAAMDALDAKDGSGDVAIIPGKLRYHKGSKNGKGTLQFRLQKDNGSDIWAAYNPYFHTSTSGMNDQFTSAWKRPNLVVVEVEIPEEEAQGGYKADFAKDSTGDTPWHSGTVNGQLPADRQRTVTLAQHAKVIRVVPDAEVAEGIAKQLEGLDIEVPFNVVSPGLREELVKRGVKIGAPEKGNAGKASIPAYEAWKTQQESDVMFSVSPEEAEIQRKAKEGGYIGKAPNGKPSRLTERQWLQTRTNPFKEWFGDWEKAAKITLMKNLAPISLNGLKSIDKKAAEKIMSGFGEATNITDGRTVKFVTDSVGKILGHKGFDYSLIIPKIKELYEGSVPMYFEKEVVKPGHKDHTSNFVGYHHYVNKITFEGKDYYVRMAVQEVRTRKKDYNPNQFHSAHITDVEIYNTDTSVTSGIIDPATGNTGIKTDAKLQNFFETAKNSSKIVDENGEPLVMSHNTEGDFTVFDRDKIGTGQGQAYLGYGFNFSRGGNGTYGNNEMRVYLDAKNPLESGKHTLSKSTVEKVLRQLDEGHQDTIVSEIAGEYAPFGTREYERAIRRAIDSIMEYSDDLGIYSTICMVSGEHAPSEIIDIFKGLGYDGTLERRESDGTIMNAVVFDANQIKSADPETRDDAGNVIPTPERFDKTKDDIRFSVGENDENAAAAEGYDEGYMSSDEIRAYQMTELARKNKEDVNLRKDALRVIGGEMSKLIRAAAAQRSYDRKTVDRIVRLARTMTDSGLYTGFSPYEVRRLMGMVNRAAGRENITKQANEVLDLLVNHQLKEYEAVLKKQLKVKGSKVDSQGVEVQAGLDIRGQRMMKAMEEGMEMDEDGLSKLIADCEERMGSENEAERKSAEDEYEGLKYAEQYHDEIKKSKQEEALLRKELKNELKKYYDYYHVPVKDKDGNVVTNEDGEVRTTERRRLKEGVDKEALKAVKEFEKETEQAIRDNRAARLDSYQDFTGRLGVDINEGRRRAKAWVEQQKQHVNEIRHNANSDLEGWNDDEYDIPPKKNGLRHNLLQSALSPLQNANEMFRYLGQKHSDGKGYLWNRFVLGYYMAGDKLWRSEKAEHDILDEKAKELFGDERFKFGGKVKRWSDLYKVVKNLPTMTIDVTNSKGAVRSYELTQGNLMYLYMCNKMNDGRMKLRRMGITEEDIAAIKEELDPRLVQLADWLQDEYFVRTREKYAPTYERMYGAPMGAIADYVPLEINKRSRGEKMELENNAPKDDQVGSTETGSVKKRTKNATPLDINTDALDLVLAHIHKMEHWNAFAELNRDMKTLLNDKTFQNRLKHVKSTRFGTGEEFWDNFQTACSLLSDNYIANTGSAADKLITNFSKGVTGAKINGRFFTALKQTLSFPAFFADASTLELGKTIGSPVDTWKWAMKNLPGFSKRWQSRQVGDTRLMETESDWDLWKNNMVQFISRKGMWANAAVDALTVACGAKAVYETKLKRYIKEGYPEEQAKSKAIADAAFSYNESQQSSENAFVSAVQIDRTLGSNMLSIFRNGPFGYGRRFNRALGRAKTLYKGDKQESIDFMAKQIQREWNEYKRENGEEVLMQDGEEVISDAAMKAAEREYNHDKWKILTETVIFGFAVQFFWNLGKYMTYLVPHAVGWLTGQNGGDDHEKAMEMIGDAGRQALFGPIEGDLFGNVGSELGNMLASGKSISNYEFAMLPVVSDLRNVMKKLDKNELAAANDMFNIIVQSVAGVNPETVTNMIVGVLDATNGDFGTAKEACLAAMRVLNAPQSAMDELYIDELGMTGKEAKGMSFDDITKRYIEYKRRREAPLANMVYSEEQQAKVDDKLLERITKKVKERMEGMSEDEKLSLFDRGDDFYKKEVGKQYAKEHGVSFSAGQKPASNWSEEKVRSHTAYQKKMNAFDMAEDVIIDEELKKAKADGDSERAAAISYIKEYILSYIKDGKPTSGDGLSKESEENLGRYAGFVISLKREKIDREGGLNGLGNGNDDEVMTLLRDIRKKVLKELGVISPRKE